MNIVHIEASWKENILTFCVNQLKNCHPREDYLKLLELTILYLESEISFRKPDALHRARWMTWVMYSLKMVLFKSQFKMIIEEVAVESYACFAVWYYVSNWFLAPLTSLAARNYLKYLQDLEFCDNDNELSLIASKTLKRHLWYLGEELVALSLLMMKWQLIWNARWLNLLRCLKKRCRQSGEAICIE